VLPRSSLVQHMELALALLASLSPVSAWERWAEGGTDLQVTEVPPFQGDSPWEDCAFSLDGPPGRPG
jgi:hypothetical protein